MAASMSASTGFRVLTNGKATTATRVQSSLPCASRNAVRRLSLVRGTPLRIRAVASAAEVDELTDVKVQLEDLEPDEKRIPSTAEIEAFLSDVCDNSSVAELVVKVGGFKLAVKRSSEPSRSAAVPSVAASTVAPAVSLVPSPPMIDTLAGNGNGSYTAAATASPIGAGEKQSAESAAEDGLLYVTSPKVGFFRKSKGGRPATSEGATVKAGHVVGYVEQLGTQFAIEAEAGGEVVEYLVDDGVAVGFGDTLVAIRPSFPGIKLA